MADKLTPKEARFVAEYLVDFNGTEAAKRAGYSVKTAYSAANRLLKKVEIQRAVEIRREKAVERTELRVERVIEELRRLALGDIGKLFDELGNLKPLHTLAPEDRACIAGVEVVIKNAKAGDGVTDTIHKIKCWDKPKSLELLARYFGILKDKLEVSGDWGTIEQRLRSARAKSEPT